MKKILLTIVTLWLAFQCKASFVPPLSSTAKISFITCEQSYDLYSIFGHTAIRVTDERNGFDVVLHWGVFDYETPNFATRFMMGTNYYMMGLLPTDFFLEEYYNRGSKVYEQELLMDNEQKHRLWNDLWINLEPENSQYLYNFVEDNCATRAINAILKAYGDNLAYEEVDPHRTYRQIIHEHVNSGCFLGMGIDLIIGSNADTAITAVDAAAFPNRALELMKHYQTQVNGIWTPIAKPEKIIVAARRSIAPIRGRNFKIQGWANSSLATIVLLSLSWASFSSKRRAASYTIKGICGVVLSATSIMGFLICFLWFISEHPLVNANYNLLWLNPLNLAIVVLMLIPKARVADTILSLISLVCATVYLEIILFNAQGASIQIALWAIATVAALIVHLKDRYTENNSTKGKHT